MHLCKVHCTPTQKCLHQLFMCIVKCAYLDFTLAGSNPSRWFIFYVLHMCCMQSNGRGKVGLQFMFRRLVKTLWSVQICAHCFVFFMRHVHCMGSGVAKVQVSHVALFLMCFCYVKFRNWIVKLRNEWWNWWMNALVLLVWGRLILYFMMYRKIFAVQLTGCIDCIWWYLSYDSVHDILK